jgi:seryl-tRNA synthetase
LFSNKRVPTGKDENQNVIVHAWGESLRKVGEHYLWHDEIAKNLHGLDGEAAARLSGSRFSVLLGPIARLERAITQYFMDFHTSRGYTEVSVPFIVTRHSLEGTGQLPKFQDDLFKLNHKVGEEETYLIPTAEVPVTNLFREQLLNHSDLPIRLVCSSPSFRAEAGSYGRDTRGLLRQHQFHKVELVKICDPEHSQAEHEQLVQDAETLLRNLQLPHRRVLLCSGDTGFSARICYDLEVWLPGQQEYREISSCSNCYDFQSKRMGLRYRPAPAPAPPSGPAAHSSHSATVDALLPPENNKTSKKKSTVYPHTINGSGLAVGR